MSSATEIAARNEAAEPGTTFVPSDFHDIASVDNANATLSRMVKRGELVRAVRGVYAKPKRLEALGVVVPPSPDAVARAIARNNRWRIAPAGDRALNLLGLDTQVPATYEYVSTGPTKRYRYGTFILVMRHRADRDLLDCSPVTCLIIQALKALGRESVTDDLARRLARSLSEEDIVRFYDETRGSTSWVFEFAKRLRIEKGC